MNENHFTKHRYHNQKIRESISEEILKAMSLTKENIVFDIGSGDGFYSSLFAKKAKKVIAIDSYKMNFEDPNYSESNIERIYQDVCEWIKVNDFSEATHVFFSNSFHDLGCQRVLLEKISKTICEGGHIDFVEFNLKASFGPPKSIRLPINVLKLMVESYGFKKVKSVDFENHYFISFVKV